MLPNRWLPLLLRFPGNHVRQETHTDLQVYSLSCDTLYIIYIQYRLYLVKNKCYASRFFWYTPNRKILSDAQMCVAGTPSSSAAKVSIDQVDTQPVDVTSLPTPAETPQRVSCRHWPQQMTRDLSIRWNQNPEQEQQKTRVQRMQSQRRRLREKISQSLPKRLRRLMMWRKKINLQKATKRLGWLKVWCTVCCSAIGLTYISYIYTHMIYKLLLHINCTFSPYLMLVDFFWLCTMTGRATSSKDHKTKPVGPKDTMWRERACQRQRAWQRAGEGKRSWEERWQWAAIG